MNEVSRELELAAHKRARQLAGFLKHLAIYIAVNIFLVILNLLDSPQHFWALGPLLGWGVGILVHGMSCWRGGPCLHEWLYKREMRKSEKEGAAE